MSPFFWLKFRLFAIIAYRYAIIIILIDFSLLSYQHTYIMKDN
jgi:hypothetical protein